MTHHMPFRDCERVSKCLVKLGMCRFWDFGIVDVVKDMFKSPRFRELYHEGRNYDDPASYFASRAFKEYDKAANGVVGAARPDHVKPTVMLQLGGDGVSLLNFGQRTATVIGVRCEELTGEASHSHLAWRPVIVIEGPKETTVLHNIMASTVNMLRRHAPFHCEGAFYFQVFLAGILHVPSHRVTMLNLRRCTIPGSYQAA